MNERIKQVLNINGLDIQHDGIVLTDNVTGAEALVRFVESVVRECAEIAYAAEPYQSHDLILKRFGFER